MQTTNLQELLRTLPVRGDLLQGRDENSLEAILLSAHENTVRFLADALLVEVASRDVLDIQDIGVAAEDTCLGIPVRVVLRKGARLLQLRSAHSVRKVMTSASTRRPFAIATREKMVHPSGIEAYTEREREYFEKYGLISSGD